MKETHFLWTNTELKEANNGIENVECIKSIEGIETSVIKRLVKETRMHALLTGSSCILMSFPKGEIIYKPGKLQFLNETTDRDRQRKCENPYWVYVQDRTFKQLLQLREEFLHFSRNMNIQKDEMYYCSTDFPIILKGKEFYINQKFIPLLSDAEGKIQIGMIEYNTSKSRKLESRIVKESGSFMEFNFELGKFDELILEIKLTRAEKMILLHLKKGLNIKAIAADMNISPNTARVHIARIHKKLGVNNQADTLAMAEKYHLLKEVTV